MNTKLPAFVAERLVAAISDFVPDQNTQIKIVVQLPNIEPKPILFNMALSTS